MARQSIEEILEKKVNDFKEVVTKKKNELQVILEELKKYQTALESLRGNIPERKRKNKEENGILN